MAHRASWAKAIVDGSILTKTELPAISSLGSNGLLEHRELFSTDSQGIEESLVDTTV